MAEPRTVNAIVGGSNPSFPVATLRRTDKAECRWHLPVLGSSVGEGSLSWYVPALRGPETSGRSIGLSPAPAGRGDGLPRLGYGWTPCEARFDHLVEATRFDSWVSPGPVNDASLLEAVGGWLGNAVGNHRPGGLLASPRENEANDPVPGRDGRHSPSFRAPTSVRP